MEQDIFEKEAIITSVERAGDELWLEFDTTIFYPGGGGQPHDIGTASAEGFEAEVKEVKQTGEKILHRVLVEKGQPKKGMEVRIHVDKGRRLRLSKMHTGEHILFKALELILEKKNQALTLAKIQLGTEQSHLFVNTTNLEWEDVFEAELLGNDMVNADLEVIRHEVPRKDIRDFKEQHGLRINEERITADFIHVTEIDTFDHSACTGTHMSRTSEVGSIIVTSLNRARGKYELTFVVDATPELLTAAKHLRLISARLQVPMGDAEARVEELLAANENLTEKVRELSYEQAGNVDKEDVNGVTLMSAVVDSLERRQLTERANSLLEEKSIICFINRTEKNAQVILLGSKDLNIDVPRMLNEVLAPFGGKGGGRENVGMGGCPLDSAEKVLPALKEQLLKR